MEQNWCKETDPVYFCNKCLSLNVKRTFYIKKGVRKEGSICGCCGSYDIKSTPFNKWVEIAEKQGLNVIRPAKWAIKLNTQINNAK